MSRLKIVIIPSWYPDKSNPLLGIFFKEQAQAISKYADVSVLAFRGEVPILTRLSTKMIMDKEEYMEGGVSTFPSTYTCIPKMRKLTQVFLINSIFKSFEKYISKFGRPDVIHAHVTYPAGYLAVILGQKYNIPTIVSEHSSNFENVFLQGFNKKYTEYVFKHADYFTAVSSFLRDKIKSAGRQQCDIIPNFINTNKFNISSVNRDKDDDFVFLCVTSLRPVKGVDVLLKSIQKLVYEKNVTNFRVDIASRLENFQLYKKMVQDLNINPWCNFLGEITREKIVEVLNESDALVIPSRMETFSIAGIEALSCGIPVVSTNCGGPIDYIDNSCGSLVENEDEESLANGMKEMIRSSKQFDRYAIRQKIVDNYSNEVVCKKTLQIYNNIIRR